MHEQGFSVAVLIPYYQEEPGVLRSTVQSALEQTDIDDFEIIVVDDDSPVSAELELQGVNGAGERVTVIHQDNAGPGAARNTAIRNIPDNTAFVAFLDSDDQLEPPFLADSVGILRQGFDLFFGNSIRAGQDASRFDWESKPPARLDVTDHELLDSEKQLYEFKGDLFDFLVYRSNIIGSSTMVCRKEMLEDVAFQEAIYNGQDRIFKLELAKKVRRCAFSPRIYAREGRGINIFDSAGWGSYTSLRKLSSYIDMCKFILGHIALSDRQRLHVQGHLNELRRTFAFALTHQLRNGSNIDWRTVRHTAISDPRAALGFPVYVVQRALTRLGDNVRRS